LEQGLKKKKAQQPVIKKIGLKEGRVSLFLLVAGIRGERKGEGLRAEN